ncbi:DUF4365 domain-containing protein [Streptomyces cellulosae]
MPAQALPSSIDGRRQRLAKPPNQKAHGGTKKTERAAVNAARTFLEAHECVVQEVDTGNDYGKDLLVDLTEDLEITGESVAIQVKGGSSFFRAGKWGIPAKIADLRLWLESSNAHNWLHTRSRHRRAPLEEPQRLRSRGNDSPSRVQADWEKRGERTRSSSRAFCAVP